MTVRVLEGDCMAILPTLPNDSVAMVLTDIPYAEVNRETSGLRDIDKGDADVLTFDLNAFVDELIRVCSGSFYVFCGVRQVSTLARAFDRHSLTIRSGGWEKTNPSPMNGEHLWLTGFEHCVFARKPNATFNAFCAPALWRHKAGTSDRHPTEKPVGLFRKLIEASTNRGDTVLDPCAGSGTAGEAADGIGRNAILIERNPEYCALIRERITNGAPLFGNPLEAA